MKRRKPYPRRRQPRKTVFTLRMWQAWIAEHAVDEQTLRLREGIAEFRQRVLIVEGRP